MKIILCAYNRVGKQVLQYIIDNNIADDIAVFSHETNDTSADVITLAKKLNVWCSTENINKSKLPFIPGIISSVYYRYIIKPHIIDTCNGNIFNAHPSLLPNHRGCSSVPWAIIDGDKVTGITYHYIDKDIDTGKIILQSSIQIEDDETQKSLYEKCMDRVFAFWPAALQLVNIGFKGAEQLGKTTTYHKRGAPYSRKIDDAWDDSKIERFIRAMHFPPLPGALYHGKEVTSINDVKRMK